MNQPDAGNCTVKPVVTESRHMSKLEEEFKNERNLKSIAISVDCSKARDSDQLLFQLSISRNSLTSGSNQSQEDQLNIKRLLFAHGKPVDQTSGRRVSSGQEGRLQFPISDILDLEHIIGAANVTSSDDEVTQNDQGFGLLARNSNEKVELLPSQTAERRASKQTSRFNFKRRGSGGKTEALSRLITLDEQVDLLKELVFTIRASNLVKTSAPHAIYGSELKLVELDKFNNQPDKLMSSSNPITAGTSQQVSRSTNQIDNIEEGSLLSHITLHSSMLNSSSMKSNRYGNNLQGISSTTTGWIQQYEISLTIVAIFATFILSLLTLTLIILVLKGRKEVRNGTVCVIEDDTIVSDNNNSTTLQPTNRIKSSRLSLALGEPFELRDSSSIDCNKISRLLEETTCLEGINFLAPPICNGSLKMARRGHLHNASDDNSNIINNNNIDISTANISEPSLVYAPNVANIFTGSNLSLTSQLEDSATGTTLLSHRTGIQTNFDCLNQDLEEFDSDQATRCDNMYLFSFL